MTLAHEVSDAFAGRITALSDFNAGAEAILSNWLQYMHTQGESIDMMNRLVSHLPFTGEELKRFFSYDCYAQMDTFHNRMFGKIITSLR